MRTPTTRRLLSTAGLVAAGGLVLSACASGSASTPSSGGSGDPYLVGVTLSLSGDFGAFGTGVSHGMEQSVAAINEAGGIDGRPLELVVLDDASNPSTSVTNTTSLVGQGVVAVAGYVQQATSTPALPVLQRSGVLGVSVSALPDEPVLETVFSSSANLNDIASGMLCYVDTYYSDAADIATVTTNGPGEQRLTGLLTTGAEKRDWTIADAETVPIGATDVTVVAAKVRDSDPDLVLMPVGGLTGGLTVKTMRDLGVEAPILGHNGVIEQASLDVYGADLNGLVGPTLIAVTDPLPNQTAFIEAYEEAYDQAPDVWGVRGYDAIQMIAAALREVPDAAQADGAELAAALEGLTIDSVVSPAPFSFTPFDGTIASRTGHKQFLWAEVVDGEFAQSENQLTDADCSD